MLKKAIRLNFRDLDAVLDNLIGDEIVLKYMDNIKYKEIITTKVSKIQSKFTRNKAIKMIKY